MDEFRFTPFIKFWKKSRLPQPPLTVKTPPSCIKHPRGEYSKFSEGLTFLTLYYTHKLVFRKILCTC